MDFRKRMTIKILPSRFNKGENVPTSYRTKKSVPPRRGERPDVDEEAA